MIKDRPQAPGARRNTVQGLRKVCGERLKDRKGQRFGLALATDHGRLTRRLLICRDHTKSSGIN